MIMNLQPGAYPMRQLLDALFISLYRPTESQSADEKGRTNAAPGEATLVHGLKENICVY